MTASSIPRIGFLGAGKMATALAKGWLTAGLTRTDHVLASDPFPQACEAFQAATKAHTTPKNLAVVDKSDVIVLAVKPQTMKALLAEIKPALTDRHLVISIAAGVPLQLLADGLGASCRLVRVMPNTPCLVGSCAAGYSPSDAARPEDLALVDQLFNTIGRAFRLPEHLLDAVTGLSGSGPAYVFVIIEALSDGGVRMGLPRDVATVLAAETVLGSAKMLLDTKEHPGTLKDMVASPGGTTIAGLHALERGGLRAALMDAVEAATRRSQELGKIV